MGTDLHPGIAPLLAPARSVAPAAERFHELVRSAILAPSGHNAQPWIFHIPFDRASVEVYADRTRALPVVDPDDRAMVIGCGAALFNLRLAARHAGYGDVVELLPDPYDRDLLARVRLGRPRDPSPEDEALFAAIPRRRTNRRAFEARPVPAELVRELRLAVAAEGAVLRVLETPAERLWAADLIAAGDRQQGADRAFRRELAAWLHPNRTHTRDGMPGYAFGMGDLASYVTPLVIRTFDWGSGQAARDRDLAIGSPLMAVLWTATDATRDWIGAGQALQHLLLRACVDGVSASFLNQPVEVPELRAMLREELGIAGHPQLLLRLGYGPEVEATPRRAIEDVIR